MSLQTISLLYLKANKNCFFVKALRAQWVVEAETTSQRCLSEIQNHLNDAQTELINTQASLAETNQALSDARAALSQTQSELQETRTALEELQISSKEQVQKLEEDLKRACADKDAAASKLHVNALFVFRSCIITNCLFEFCIKNYVVFGCLC